MALKLENGSCQSELDRVIAGAVITREALQDRAKKYEALFPLERSGFDGPVVNPNLIDQELIDKYKLEVVDYAAIMSKMRDRPWRRPVPFFAAFDLEDSNPLCGIYYRRSVAGTDSVTNSHYLQGKAKGVPPYPNESLNKMLHRIQDWEIMAFGKAIVFVGCFVGATLFAIPFFLGAGWVFSVILGWLCGGSAAALCGVIPANDSDIKLFTSFKGLMFPDDVREKLLELRDKFDYILIVPEIAAKDWSTQKIPKPKAGDPIAIGFKCGVAYKICTFFTTPAEHYAASEFSTKP